MLYVDNSLSVTAESRSLIMGGCWNSPHVYYLYFSIHTGFWDFRKYKESMIFILKLK